MVEAISRSQLIDNTQCIFKCPSKVQVSVVFFGDITGEMLGNDGKSRAKLLPSVKNLILKNEISSAHWHFAHVHI